MSMNDQANRLRDLIEVVKARESASEESAAAQKVQYDSRVIAISSGKGGVGKTSIAVNLAIALQDMGKRVALIDADLGLANVDVVLGLVPRYNMFHLIAGEKTIEDITLIGPKGIKVLSGGSGALDLVNLDDQSIKKLIELLLTLNQTTDYIIIDTGAGINRSVLSFIEATDELIVVVTPDPTSITDAYAVVKNTYTEEKNIKVIVNQTESAREGQMVFEKLNTASKKFLDAEISYLGFIMNDKRVQKSVRAQTPFYIVYPDSSASQSIGLIAHQLENIEPVKQKRTFGGFIKRLLMGG